MYTMFLNLPLSWYTLHALFGCCRRARLTGILLCYLFLLPWPPLFPVFLLASCFLICFHARLLLVLAFYPLPPPTFQPPLLLEC